MRKYRRKFSSYRSALVLLSVVNIRIRILSTLYFRSQKYQFKFFQVAEVNLCIFGRPTVNFNLRVNLILDIYFSTDKMYCGRFGTWYRLSSATFNLCIYQDLPLNWAKFTIYRQIEVHRRPTKEAKIPFWHRHRHIQGKANSQFCMHACMIWGDLISHTANPCRVIY